MSQAQPDANAAGPAAAPPRFSWPMRIFLSLLLFDIVGRSLLVLVPCSEWAAELDMETMPWRLPTRAEVKTLEAELPQRPSAVRDRYFETLDSLWEYGKPWPAVKTRARIDSWPKMGMFAVCWVNSRFEFLENVLGINEEWPMFSPNVGSRRTLARSKLLFADGSMQTVRLTADPADLTRYSHWFEEKVLDYELKVDHDSGNRFGYCNYLAHRHPRNAAGSPLVSIYVYTVTYYYPEPDKDPVEYLRSQNGPPLEQVTLPFYVYDVTSREGRDLEEFSDSLLVTSGWPFPGAFVNFALAGQIPKVVFELDK